MEVTTSRVIDHIKQTASLYGYSVADSKVRKDGTIVITINKEDK